MRRSDGTTSKRKGLQVVSLTRLVFSDATIDHTAMLNPLPVVLLLLLPLSVAV